MAFRISYFIILILFSFSSVTGVAQAASKEFIGEWLYHKILYQGRLIEPLDPDLVMTYRFEESGTNTIKYYRAHQAGFCERTATWSFDAKKKSLYQKVISVNPENDDSCQKDPDMQMNHESWSRLQVVNNQLYLSLPLDEEDLILIWKRTNPEI